MKKNRYTYTCDDVGWRAMSNIISSFYAKFFFDSILFRWISLISFNFCAKLLWLFIRYILKVIWKSLHWHLFPLQIFFWKNRTSITNATLVLIYLAPVTLCYNYSFHLPFIHPEMHHSWWCCRKKLFFKFSEQTPICILKK